MNIARYAVTLSITTLILAVTGCAIVKETYMPDGSKGYSISCDGAAVGINVCFEKAGDLCGASGYDLITREGQVYSFRSWLRKCVWNAITNPGTEFCHLWLIQYQEHHG